jgi:hypothetical protein
MTASAIALAGALLMAGVPGIVLLALTPGLLCLAMAVVMGHGDPHGEAMLRTARIATARQAGRRVSGARQTPSDLGKAPLIRRAPARGVVRAH